MLDTLLMIFMVLTSFNSSIYSEKKRKSALFIDNKHVL